MTRASLVELPPALLSPRAPAGARYVMGIDGGATKTLAAVLDLRDRTLHLARAGPSNEDAIGVQPAVAALLGVADRALGRAGIAQTDLAGAVLAVAGTDTEAIAHHVGRARSEDWIVVNDVVGAWATATGGARPGVAAISGTGSNVFGVGFGGEPWRAGGWGHLLGDEGSGYWLGVQALRAALHDRDGSGPSTALSAAAVEFFGTDNVEAVAALVYSKPLTKGEIAAFATQAATIAQQGDEVARALYTRAGRELAAQIAVVLARTGLSEADQRFPVGLIGSAYRAGPVFVDPLRDVVLERAPRAEVAVVQMAPVGGSLLLAAHACGCELNSADLSRLLDAAVAELLD
jgi:glucosamine kinase